MAGVGCLGVPLLCLDVGTMTLWDGCLVLQSVPRLAFAEASRGTAVAPRVRCIVRYHGYRLGCMGSTDCGWVMSKYRCWCVRVRDMIHHYYYYYLGISQQRD